MPELTIWHSCHLSTPTIFSPSSLPLYSGQSEPPSSISTLSPGHRPPPSQRLQILTERGTPRILLLLFWNRKLKFASESDVIYVFLWVITTIAEKVLGIGDLRYSFFISLFPWNNFIYFCVLALLAEWPVYCRAIIYIFFFSLYDIVIAVNYSST